MAAAGTSQPAANKITTVHEWLYAQRRGALTAAFVDHGFDTLSSVATMEREDIEGIRGMKVGGKRKMLIPPELAYGDEGGGPLIPPGAALEYETTLVNSAKLSGLELIASKIPGGKTNLGLGAAIVLLGVLNFLGIIS